MVGSSTFWILALKFRYVRKCFLMCGLPCFVWFVGFIQIETTRFPCISINTWFSYQTSSWNYRPWQGSLSLLTSNFTFVELCLFQIHFQMILVKEVTGLVLFWNLLPFSIMSVYSRQYISLCLQWISLWKSSGQLRWEFVPRFYVLLTDASFAVALPQLCDIFLNTQVWYF